MKKAICLAIFTLVTFTCFPLAAGPPAVGIKKPVKIDTEGSCFSKSCHGDMSKNKVVHEPAKGGTSCTDCHEAAQEGRHSFSLSGSGRELCLSCHEEKGDKKFVHSALSDGTCQDCHDPHGSEFPYQLIQAPAPDLCFGCHDEEDFSGRTVHSPVIMGKCLTCHDPHSTDNPRQLLAARPGLCFNCHGKELADREGGKIAAVKALYGQENTFLHRPFKEGKCNSCHAPHASDTYRLLKGVFPRSLYSHFDEKSYSLCLSCHKKLAKALREPRTEKSTAFRNGDMNLHFFHVVTKGRSCKACHHHHGSKQEKLIRTSVIFGKKAMRMVYKRTSSGGSCAPACHAKKSYDRNAGIDYNARVLPDKR